ncbi:hypothetical protein [Desulfuromonas soudanensis]|uniref:hypothetical protein n=1 Tax=Desulfuromonas soudanensis TaxID=1603606 RepID=UPI001E461837|nr:hypothetical protein [Desulfuromonas soudanensis]
MEEVPQSRASLAVLPILEGGVVAQVGQKGGDMLWLTFGDRVRLHELDELQAPGYVKVVIFCVDVYAGKKMGIGFPEYSVKLMI